MHTYPKVISYWLILGLVLVFFQVIIGGVTRLTESGLSITRWEVVEGTLPPLSAAQWEEAFQLYKETPQYQKINEGMNMADFKFIYFWEYLHRLWARMMGFVFLIPLFFFWRKGWIDKALGIRLGVIFLLAGLAASFGWIMVASGLIERPWVNAYKLTIHLSIALGLISYLFWTILKVTYPQPASSSARIPWTGLAWFGGFLVVQVLLGGVMSGMKAALYYPTWPDMNGVLIPSVLLESTNYTWSNLIQYDQGGFAAALIQFLHRGTAYLLVIMGATLGIQLLRQSISIQLRIGTFVWIGLLSLQVVLGISTLMASRGSVPVDLGVLHQAVAVLLVLATLFLGYHRQQLAGDSTTVSHKEVSSVVTLS